MTFRTLSSAAAAVALAGLAVSGSATAASAQTAPCYPPPCSATISDTTVVPGQPVVVNSGAGEFTPGSQVNVTIPRTSVAGTVTADNTGNGRFTFTLPQGTPPGRYAVVFVGPRSGVAVGRFGMAAPGTTNTVEVPFTVVSAAAAEPGQGQRSSALPQTGSDQLIPLTAAGVALVGIGAGIVVAAGRRRRSSMPQGLA